MLRLITNDKIDNVKDKTNIMRAISIALLVF